MFSLNFVLLVFEFAYRIFDFSMIFGFEDRTQMQTLETGLDLTKSRAVYVSWMKTTHEYKTKGKRRQKLTIT